jgi:hypothetical protein
MAIKCRCYLLENDRIRSVEVVEAADDGAAHVDAGRILEASARTPPNCGSRSPGIHPTKNPAGGYP